MTFTDEQIKLIYLRFKNINYPQEQLQEHIIGNSIVESIEKHYAEKNGKVTVDKQQPQPVKK